jgi:hypothetical protein
VVPTEIGTAQPTATLSASNIFRELVIFDRFFANSGATLNRSHRSPASEQNCSTQLSIWQREKRVVSATLATVRSSALTDMVFALRPVNAAQDRTAILAGNAQTASGQGFDRDQDRRAYAKPAFQRARSGSAGYGLSESILAESEISGAFEAARFAAFHPSA